MNRVSSCEQPSSFYPSVPNILLCIILQNTGYGGDGGGYAYNNGGSHYGQQDYKVEEKKRREC
jgi:hypothetical protein